MYIFIHCVHITTVSVLCYAVRGGGVGWWGGGGGSETGKGRVWEHKIHGMS